MIMTMMQFRLQFFVLISDGDDDDNDDDSAPLTVLSAYIITHLTASVTLLCTALS